MRLHLIRHGEENRSAQIMPSSVRRAAGVRDAVSRRKGALTVVVSPAPRAVQTAELIFGGMACLLLDPRVDEMSYVPGVPPRQRRGEIFAGESWFGVLRRVSHFLDEVSRAHEEVFVVTHSGVFDAVNEITSGLPNRTCEMHIDWVRSSSWTKATDRWILLGHNRELPFGFGPDEGS